MKATWRQKKENCESKNAHKVKKECTIHHHLPTHAEKPGFPNKRKKALEEEKLCIADDFQHVLADVWQIITG